jgi:DNA-binding NtrC family response regulator
MGNLKNLAPAEELTSSNFREAKQRLLEGFERSYLTQLMKECGGRVIAAARRAQIDRAHLYRLLKKYGLAPPSRSNAPEVAPTTTPAIFRDAG